MNKLSNCYYFRDYVQ